MTKEYDKIKKISQQKIFEIRKLFKPEKFGNNWDENNDKILINFISKNPNINKKWKKVSLILKNKTPKQCFKRFRIINPFYNKGKFSHEEDKLILNLFHLFGKNWNLISNTIKKRSSRQIKVRYENHLCPDINKNKFNFREDRIIFGLFPKYKNNWSKYTTHIKGRTARKIKLRYISLIKKKRKIEYLK